MDRALKGELRNFLLEQKELAETDVDADEQIYRNVASRPFHAENELPDLDAARVRSFERLNRVVRLLEDLEQEEDPLTADEAAAEINEAMYEFLNEGTQSAEWFINRARNILKRVKDE